MGLTAVGALVVCALLTTVSTVIVFAAGVRRISGRKRDEQALRASEERYRRFLDVLPDAVFVLEGDDLVSYGNPAYVTRRGATSVNDVIGTSIFDMYAADDRDSGRGSAPPVCLRHSARQRPRR